MKKLALVFLVMLLVLGFAFLPSASPPPVPLGEYYVYHLFAIDGEIALWVNRSALYVYDNGSVVQLAETPDFETRLDGGFARGNADEAEIARVLARLQRNPLYRPPQPRQWVCICCSRRVNRNGGATYTSMIIDAMIIIGLPIALITLLCVLICARRKKRKKLETE